MVNANVVQAPLQVVVDVSGTTFRVLKEELRLCPWEGSSSSETPSTPRDNTQSASPSLPHSVADDRHGPDAHLVEGQEPLGYVRLSGDSSVVRTCRLTRVMYGYGCRLIFEDVWHICVGANVYLWMCACYEGMCVKCQMVLGALHFFCGAVRTFLFVL